MSLTHSQPEQKGVSFEGDGPAHNILQASGVSGWNAFRDNQKKKKKKRTRKHHNQADSSTRQQHLKVKMGRKYHVLVMGYHGNFSEYTVVSIL